MTVTLEWSMTYEYEVDPVALVRAFPAEWEEAVNDAQRGGYAPWERFVVLLNGVMANRALDDLDTVEGIRLLHETEDAVDIAWSPLLAEELDAALAEPVPPAQDTRLPLA